MDRVKVMLLFICGVMLPALAPTTSAQTNKTTPTASQVPNKPATQTGGRPATSSATPAAKAAATAGQPAPRYVNCHAFEMHTNTQPAVTIVVFTQRDKPDHARLSDLLKENDGAGVELRTSDGKWHRATLVRLRTCFGRGLLFLAGDAEEPKDRENFLLRFPPKKIS